MYINKKLLAEIFIEKLKACNEDIGSCYYHIFSKLLTEDELQDMINNLYDRYTFIHNLDKLCGVTKTEKDEWFYKFHKSIRQSDFFENIKKHYYVNELTEDENKRMNELKAMLPQHKKFYEAVDGKEARETGLEVELNEYYSLFNKKRVKKTKDVSGCIDMILWNLIHIDVNNLLQKVMVSTFKQYNFEQES